MHFIQAVILGIVEGVTEFLPISSTGHLILSANILHLSDTDFLKSFEIIIQLGAILAVIVLFFKKFFNWELLKRLVVAFVPTGVIGLLAYKFFKNVLLANTQVVVWSLAIGGLILILFEMWHRESEDTTDELAKISYKQSFLIGCFQAIAIIPGVSRSAATIVGGLLVGIRRRTIVEFSFMLAVPTMIAATGLDLLKSYKTLTSGGSVSLLSVGFVVSFLVAWASIKWFIGYIQKHNFKPFGIYRIAVAVLFWFFAK
jgi:undecaprenyl-diphosphatase